MTSDEIKEIFSDLEYIHPDCWFRLKREGNVFHFMVSTNDENYEVISTTAVPNHDHYDIRMPVNLPDNTAEPFILPREGDEDDIT